MKYKHPILVIMTVLILQNTSLFAQKGSGVGGGPSFKYATSSLAKVINTNVNKQFADSEPPTFNEQFMLFNGGEGYINNKGVSFGGAGWSGSTEQTSNGNKVTYRLNYGGFIFGYEFVSSTLFGLSVSNMIGYGTYEYNRYNSINTTSTSATYFHIKGDLFLFEPNFMVRLNMTSFFGFGLVGSYLWATHTSVYQEGKGPNSKLLETSKLAGIAPSHPAFRIVIFLGKY